MRCLLLSFFLLLCMSGFGQVEDQAQPKTNKNAPSQDKRLEKSKDEAISDSTAMELLDSESLDEIEISNKQKKSDKGSYRNTIMQEPEEEATSEQLSQSVSSNFKYTKTQSSTQRKQRSPSLSQQAEMNEAVGYFEDKAPNSFEYHYFKYVSGNYDISLFSHLVQAEKIRSNNADVHVQMAAYYIIQNKKSEAKSYIEKLIKAHRLTENVLKYAEDILLSAPKNGTLITHGFDDSYATWYLQTEKNIRTDVKLVSLDFMQSKYYRSELNKAGYLLPKSENIDVNYFETFCKLNSSRKMSASLTMPKEYFQPIMSNVYVVGLVFEYHNNSFNNFMSNENLWNNVLKKHLVISANDEKAKRLSSNYLPMLLQMRKVYGQKNDKTKVDELDKVIDKIGAQCKKYEQVQNLKRAY